MLNRRIEAIARRLGFDLLGIVPAAPPATLAHFRAWLAKGYHGGMGYLARPDAVARRADPARILPGARSLIVVGLNYHTRPLPPALRDDPARGLIASYAWGADYHDLMLPRLEELAAALEDQTRGPIAHRAYVDTGPLLERDLAAAAGLGFVGKNTNLIHPRVGSWLFLGELLLSADLLLRDGGGEGGTCGRCRRCLEACPTAAFAAPYLLDARRCISYLTIEHRGPIPRELRPLLGNRIFGCDICQEVCPWNRRFARPGAEPGLHPRDAGSIAPHLLDLLALDEGAFRRRFRRTPIWRARRRGLLRNAAVAAGNWGDPAAVPALARALDDDEPLIRSHAAWALGRIGGERARSTLARALAIEADDEVRAEIEAARAR
jgi:epoxyqueuosine reductase